MKLNEIFSDEFIAKLNTLNAGSDLDPEEEVKGFIDIEKILTELNFEISRENNMNGSGRIKGNRIYIDDSEIKSRQRFTMAHELGHAMQNIRNANRKDDPDDYDFAERKNEVFANTFAAQLLMPKKLVLNAINEVIENRQMDSKHLDDSQIDVILNDVAEKLQVSKGAIKYRVKNLNIFVPLKGENK
ncbi:ImmA/IrrE family metallo-endopeptidase [Companilactobacillus farciminis]|uniref:ImmA/IrrE family metallo-endopeptidase n=1 Tax=Companilactobacillus farciminis TaxID=1612 RepID=UPI00191524B7|nr:ImmA/IrrE family metallo-endopeptidase [Companilactobacillus farciminis]